MAIYFEVKAPLDSIDTPILNLRSKKFRKVILLGFEEIITFTTDEKEHESNIVDGRKSIYGDEIKIEIHSEHLQWIDHGKLNILPYSSINRWVLE